MTLTDSKNQTSVARLQKNRRRLLTYLPAKGKINDLLLQQTAMLDHYFMERFAESRVGPQMNFHKTPYAMIALGGYGRQEQCLHSDIDFLLLFQKTVPPESKPLIREIIYPLWDMGFTVGHATRSIKECLRLAAEDLEVLTALLDARFLSGMSPLYTELRERLHRFLTGSRSRRTIAALLERTHARHQKYGDASYLLEPNLKEGQGGLRDYHTILWIARLTDKIIQPRDLEYNGTLSHEEFQQLETALAFIWKTRNLLHFLTGKKSDQLFFAHQETMADILGYTGSRGQMAVERFLGQLHEHLDYIKQTCLVFLAETGPARRAIFRRAAGAGQSRIDGLKISDNLLGFASPEHILASPHLLIKLFEESARRQLPIHSEARRTVKEFLYLVDTRFRRDPQTIETFERILTTPARTFNTLDEMRKTGLLQRLIPRLQPIINRIQYDGYHLYPIDRHCLKTVKIIKELTAGKTTESLPALLLQDFGPHQKMLLWAALLHDIGKGETGSDHSRQGAKIAAGILTDFGYQREFVATVAFLIEEHLLMIKTATRRDLEDEETALTCARRIKDVKRLKMLYLLTIADSMATGPKAWNDWSAALLRDLFFKTLKILEKGELASYEAVATLEKKKQAVLDSAVTREEGRALLAHLELLSPRYLLYTPAAVILEHRHLYRLLQKKSFVWNIQPAENLEARTVTICAPDRPGLFAKIAGVFALNGLDILQADIFTWKNNTALDIFTVRPPADILYEKERWQKAKRHLHQAIKGDLDLAASLTPLPPDNPSGCHYAIRPHRITIDNQSSSFFTIIEVIAYDFPGLLFHITDALYRQDLDVRLAKIATKIDQGVDVFYVRNVYGQKIENTEQIDSIRTAVEAVMPGAVEPEDA